MTQHVTTTVQAVPFAELEARVRKLFMSEAEAADPAAVQAAPGETCSTVDYAEYLQLLAAASLTSAQQDRLAAFVKTDFEHEYATPDGHFLVKWDTTGSFAVTQAIVDDAIADLQDAYEKYNRDFGQPPSPDTIQVLFDNARTPQTVPPSGPISLPGQYMMGNADNGLLRKITATHELFHVLQGGFGFVSNAVSKWFYEGGATWSEIVYYNAVSGDLKVPYIFRYPLTPIAKQVYGSVSFFIFLENYYFAEKTGAWFMVDWFQYNEAKRQGSVWYELNQVAMSLVRDTNLNFLFVQFGIDLAAKTWFQTADGAVAIPPPRLAESPPSYPIQQYSDMALNLPNGNVIALTGPSFTGVSNTDPKLTSTQLYFWKVTASSATTPYTVFGQFSQGQRNNPYVGAAVVDPLTGDPIAGHTTTALSTEYDHRDFNFVSDTEMAYFVTAGPWSLKETAFTFNLFTHSN